MIVIGTNGVIKNVIGTNVTVPLCSKYQFAIRCKNERYHKIVFAHQHQQPLRPLP